MYHVWIPFNVYLLAEYPVSTSIPGGPLAAHTKLAEVLLEA